MIKNLKNIECSYDVSLSLHQKKNSFLIVISNKKQFFSDEAKAKRHMSILYSLIRSSKLSSLAAIFDTFAPSLRFTLSVFQSVRKKVLP